MGIIFRKKQNLDKDTWLNYSGSGVSGSKRIGPVTFNSRGGYTVRLGKGLTFRGRWRK
ncbi:hypothetical protein [Corynebacterium lactis]|uniref:DUF4236 domain-containing protein n=1 Tax=Corynebacterium lactis RW2-5 TaxID=1408189 RepID=A0A0K2H289_9CORY|nr:hypothetical protein [Corynebacterium lactis]ALA68063.1 hypothetical protein CLAC_10710 [Corynebacterium lactis RW2-5]